MIAPLLDGPPIAEVPATLREASDDRFRLLVEAVHDYGIFMIDPDGLVFSWNPGAEKANGYTTAEMLGQHIALLYTPDDVAAGRPAHGLREALRTGRFEEEGVRLRKGNVPYVASVVITSIRDEHGTHLGFANVTRDLTAQRAFGQALHLRDRALASLTQGVFIIDCSLADAPISYANDAFLTMSGYTREECLGRPWSFLRGAETSASALDKLRAAVTAEQSATVELVSYRKDGTHFWNAMTISPIRNGGNHVTHFVAVQTDVSSFKLLEQQYRQSQKMEAVGQLAGGVAHDFNNLLTVIAGYSEMLLMMLPPKDPTTAAVQAISEAGDRAAGLTRQLLAFSRQAVLETRIVDLNEVVQDAETLLARMLGEDIELKTLLGEDLRRVHIDPGQFGQVLINLAVNARDAMPQGGKLTIQTSMVCLDDAYAAQHADVQPGLQVRLDVSDNGCGMSPSVRAKVFEPFFTTKDVGKGTGLGLATVHGIVKQSGGSVNVYSEVGIGTSFSIYLPTVDAAEPAHPLQRDESADLRGHEIILLVEDDEAVREVALRALTAQGYTVWPAASGARALEMRAAETGQVDLLVTDVVMPGMSGRALAEEVATRYPQLKVLFLSGYTDDAVIRHGILREDVFFLQKPFTPRTLGRKVREVLDR